MPKSILIVLCLVVFLFIIFSVPVWDIDFWWHLATGKYIVEHKTLPETDPFSYTSGQHISAGREIILEGYWLAQVIFFLAFKLAGLYGIITLRASILIVTFLLIYVWAKKNKADAPVILFFIVLTGWFLTYFTGERPQLFSFFFVTFTVFLLESFRERNIKKKNNLWIFFLLPVVMLAWANCHGGFVLGTAIMTLYWCTEFVKILLRKNQSDKRYFRQLALLIIIAATVSFINPATYKIYFFTLKLQGSVLQQRTSEYLSPLAFPVYGAAVWPYWAYLSITIATFILSRKKIEATHTVITLFLAMISLSAFRYIPFFVYITIPYTAMYVTLLIKDRPRLHGVVNSAGLPILIVIMAYISVSGYNDSLGKSIKHPIKEYRFPEKAASFIKHYSPRGNLFNHFNWGGYLIWELSPEYKVFIDGRALNLIAFRDYTYMLWDIPEARQLFDRYGINTVIIQAISPFTGELYTIVNYLVRDSQWHLVYIDETSLIFIRGSENAAIIRTFSIPKTEAYNQVIMQATRLLNSGIKNIHVQQALDTAYKAKSLLGDQ